jgi:hypothetical protein
MVFNIMTLHSLIHGEQVLAGKNCLHFQGMSEPGWQIGCLYVDGPQRVVLARAWGKGRCDQDWTAVTTGPEKKELFQGKSKNFPSAGLEGRQRVFQDRRRKLKTGLSGTMG